MSVNPVTQDPLYQLANRCLDGQEITTSEIETALAEPFPRKTREFCGGHKYLLLKILLGTGHISKCQMALDLESKQFIARITSVMPSTLSWEYPTLEMYKRTTGIVNLLLAAIWKNKKGQDKFERYTTLYNGGSLSSFTSRYCNFSMNGLAIVFRDSLLGLTALHDKGYVHRDISSHNIFLTKNTNEIQSAVIGDFEYAGPLKDLVNQALAKRPPAFLPGTMDHFSPEKARESLRLPNNSLEGFCQAFGEASDVWGLGIVFINLYSTYLDMKRLPIPIFLSIFDRWWHYQTKQHGIFWKAWNSLSRESDPNKKATFSSQSDEARKNLFENTAMLKPNWLLPVLPQESELFEGKIHALLNDMLHPDPEKRITARDALDRVNHIFTVTTTVQRTHLF